MLLFSHPYFFDSPTFIIKCQCQLEPELGWRINKLFLFSLLLCSLIYFTTLIRIFLLSVLAFPYERHTYGDNIRREDWGNIIFDIEGMKVWKNFLWVVYQLYHLDIYTRHISLATPMHISYMAVVANYRSQSSQFATTAAMWNFCEWVREGAKKNI